MGTNDLIFYLDKLRMLKNISQEDFVDGIISLRQYHRYIAGTSTFPFELFDKFSSRLDLRAEILLQNFEKEKHEEAILLNSYYDQVSQHNYEEALEIKAQIDPNNFLNQYSYLLYEHTNNHYAYMHKQITKSDLLFRTQALINYPDILKSSVYSNIEFLVLSSLLSIDEFDGDLLYEKLISILDQGTLVIDNHNNNGYLLTLYRLARYSGFKFKNHESIKFSKMIVDYNKKRRTIYLLDFAYLFLATNYYQLGEEETYKSYLVKLYFILKVIDSKGKYDSFSNTVKTHLHIDLEDFVLSYMQKKETT